MKPVSTPLFTDLDALAKLKAPGGEGDSLRQVAEQFEALFTHMLLKNMRAASLASGVFDSNQSEFYRDMFDQQMSTELSRGGGLGIAELLVRQLGGSRQASSESAAPTRVETARWRAVTSADGPRESRRPIASVQEFVNRFAEHAERAGEALGVAPRLILAQAALETGWGRQPIRNPDGSNANNLFGIKASGGWTGGRAVVETLEFAAGVGRRVKAAFRSYPSAADGFADYARLLKNSPRYRDVLQTGDDAAAFAQGLERGGYATDPAYADKLAAIANGSRLKNAMSALKNP